MGNRKFLEESCCNDVLILGIWSRLFSVVFKATANSEFGTFIRVCWMKNFWREGIKWCFCKKKISCYSASLKKTLLSDSIHFSNIGLLKDQDDDCPVENEEQEYVAISLYYVDGPVGSVELFSKVGFVGGPTLLEDQEIGRESSLFSYKIAWIFLNFRNSSLPRLWSWAFNGAQATTFRICKSLFINIYKTLKSKVTANMNKKIRVAVTLEMDAKLFKVEAYLNAVSPTPFCSFLTTNYRARACSKVS